MPSLSRSPAPLLDRRPVVVGYDGSAASMDALDRGIDMARALDVPLHVLTAWEHAEQYGGALSGWTEDRVARQILDEAVRSRFGAEPPAWLVTEARLGGAAQMLIHASLGAQMLIIGSRGHGRVMRMLIGSVSMACVQSAACPVLVTNGALSHPFSPAEERATRDAV
jgi:nucleotide-binding universal stress UspA family protein